VQARATGAAAFVVMDYAQPLADNVVTLVSRIVDVFLHLFAQQQKRR